MRWGSGLIARLNGKAGRVVVACAVLGLGVAAAAAAQDDGGAGVLKVRLGGDAHQTRIVVELDRSVQGRLLAKETTARSVVVALPQVGAPGGMQGQGAGLVKGWSVEEASGGARIKLDLVRAAVIKRRFLLAPGDGVSVYRYVIDLSEDGLDASDAAVPGAVAAASQTPRPQKVKAPLQPLVPSKKVVVIDAGHGGKDPGALGADNREKDLTLAAARALRDRLERSGRYRVVLTRDTDVFVPLERRVQIARRANADLFISLHADSQSDPSIRGATVYTLSEKGADRAARRAFDRDGFVDVALPGADESVNRILLDLTQRGTVNRSSTFAETLLHRIGDRTPLLQRSHRDAGYMVLLAPDVPAVLLEMGFVTNAEDERALADPDHRRDLMEGVSQAIDDYFAQESRFAMQ
ncbi:MAG TPA: N-acetylmuramoyl-L-alanine amidase [Caulobacteraceae bacterium]|jgi:N-acetylmuramoyl-L-alanine amidase|nr:N-acetylmuramoyl-L-alanine amidase [Caulobacteraceae bacterium]